MATKVLFRFAAIAALLLSAAACKYPYDVVLPSTDYPLVIEGDILLGTTSTFRFSYVLPLDADNYVVPARNTSGYIEGENGVRVDGILQEAGAVLDFDTSRLPENQRYKIHLQTPEGRTIESDWLNVCPAPVIDDLSYWKNEEFNEVHIGLSMHCNGAKYFRWTFLEEWEYHSDIRSIYTYDPSRYKEGVIPFPDYQPMVYYCWDRCESPAINIFTTENQTEDRFEELSFHRIPVNNLRLQMLYRMTLMLEALSEEAYAYWRTVRQNSEEQGSLFAPTPSEMASNLHCTSDPSYQVLGYVNAAVAATTRMYYDNLEAGFYRAPYVPPSSRRERDVPLDPDSCALAYKEYLLPFNPVYDMMGKISAYSWADHDCIDCRSQGGNKNRPADWPNEHP
jgi:hypothetical protein